MEEFPRNTRNIGLDCSMIFDLNFNARNQFSGKTVKFENAFAAS